MQYSLPLADENRLLDAHRLLLAAFGPVPASHRLDPVGQMVLAMLSRRTRDALAMGAFMRLARHLNGWEKLAAMEPHILKPLIFDITFAERKAVYLPEAIRRILSLRGRLDLGFLAAWPVETARRWLEALPGVGAKTSAAVLNVSTLHRRILTADTHHVRAAQRLGFVPPKADIARTIRLLNRRLPDAWNADDTEAHHVLMQRLGQMVCTHRDPGCAGCPLCGLCPAAAGEGCAP